MPTFNLVDQPFISCVRGGRVDCCGLAETLADAHAIDELRDPSPLVTVALHRLLLAILHRALGGPDCEDTWAEWWQAGRFPAGPIERYFATWRGRFDLFDLARPFFQVAAFATKQANGVNQLVRELARGNNATLFDHTHEDPPPLMPAAAVARALVADQAFAVGGGRSETGYTSSAPAAGGVVVLVRGANLFETLLLNLTAYNPVTHPADTPAWERDGRPIDGSQSPDGPVDYLTWQSRSVRLLPEDDGSVRHMAYAAGRTYDPKPAGYDPMTAYTRPDDKTEERAVRLSEAKDLWRDSAALFQFDHAPESKARPPANLEWLKGLKEDGSLPAGRTFGLAAVGLCTDKAKVNFWRHDTLPLPLDYLSDKELVVTLRECIAIAEEVGKRTRFAAATFAKLVLTANPDGTPDKKRLYQVVDSLGADALYWSRLEEPFRRLMAGLPGDADHRLAQKAGWFYRLRDTAIDALLHTAKQKFARERRRRAAVTAVGQLYRSLNKLGKQYQIPKPAFAVGAP